MNTISMHRELGGTAEGNSRGFVATVAAWGERPQGAVAAWLPVPPMSRPRTKQPERSRVAVAVKELWIPLSESLAEKGFFALLVVGAVSGISYGFSCILDLVQNWAAVNASISHLIQ
jgi:hypothetical protein